MPLSINTKLSIYPKSNIFFAKKQGHKKAKKPFCLVSGSVRSNMKETTEVTEGINNRINYLVENQVIVELKAVETINKIYEAQLLTYLRAMEKRVGLIINFNLN